MGILPLVFERFLGISLRRNCRTLFKRMTRPNDPRNGACGWLSGVREGEFRAQSLD
jgi:hypothetical protein